MPNRFEAMMNKPVEWVIMVIVVALYLIMRSKHLVWWERIGSAGISAGLAYAGSAELSAWIGGSELLSAILIMMIGPAILGAVMTAGEDEDFLKRTLQDWARKRLGLGDRDDKPKS